MKSKTFVDLKSYHHGFLLGEKLGYERGLKEGRKLEREELRRGIEYDNNRKAQKRIKKNV